MTHHLLVSYTGNRQFRQQKRTTDHQKAYYIIAQSARFYSN